MNVKAMPRDKCFYPLFYWSVWALSLFFALLGIAGTFFCLYEIYVWRVNPAAIVVYLIMLFTSVFTVYRLGGFAVTVTFWVLF